MLNNNNEFSFKIFELHRLTRKIYLKKAKKTIEWTTIITKNNIFSTIHSTKSNKTITKSAGSIGITNKKTGNIVYRYLIKIFSLFLNSQDISITILLKKSLTRTNKKRILSNILKTKLLVRNIYNFGTIAHGGTKLKKKRRL